MFGNRWGNELIGDVVAGDTQPMEKVKQRLDTVGLAVAGTGAIAASIHLCLVRFQMSEGYLR